MGGWDAPWHWVILAIVVIALVGYKKLPDAARSVGRSLRIFKTEIKGMTGDDKARDSAADRAAGRSADSAAEPRTLPRAEIVPPGASARSADRPRPRPTPTPSTGQRSTDAG